MVRDYSRGEYLEKADYVRAVCPDLSLSTDIIVGYPARPTPTSPDPVAFGLRRVRQRLFVRNSERPDTPALKLALRDNVPPAVRPSGCKSWQAHQKPRSAPAGCGAGWTAGGGTGEGESARHAGQLCGRTTGNQMVAFAGAPALIGQRCPCT